MIVIQFQEKCLRTLMQLQFLDGISQILKKKQIMSAIVGEKNCWVDTMSFLQIKFRKLIRICLNMHIFL